MDPLSAFATAEPMLDTLLPSAFAFGLLAFITILILAVYLYTAFALMTIARKTGTPHGWLAFIPIASAYLLWRISRTPAWTVISVFSLYGVMTLGFVGAFAFIGASSGSAFLEGFGSIALVFVAILLFAVLSMVVLAIQSYWWWRIAERRNYPGAVGLLMTLPTILQSFPYVGFVFGIVPLVTIGILAWREQDAPAPQRADAEAEGL